MLATGLPSFGGDASTTNGEQMDTSEGPCGDEDPANVDPASHANSLVIDWLRDRLKEFGRVTFVKMPRYVVRLVLVP